MHGELEAVVGADGEDAAEVVGQGDMCGGVGAGEEGGLVDEGGADSLEEERVREAETEDVVDKVHTVEVEVEDALEASVRDVLLEVGGEGEAGLGEAERGVEVDGAVGAGRRRGRRPLYEELEAQVAVDGVDVEGDVGVGVGVVGGGAGAHVVLEAEEGGLHGRGEAGDLRTVGVALATDGAAPVVCKKVHGEGACVKDVTARELGSVVGMVFEPDGAEVVNVDVGDVDVEDASGFAGEAGTDKDGEILKGLDAPVQ